MAQPAYNLEHFAPSGRVHKPRVQVAKPKRNPRRVQLFKTLRTLSVVLLFVVLVCGVLYTQATLTEVQTDITRKEKELAEEKSLNAYLSFELDNMTSLKNIEERAEMMGLVPMDGNQITYLRVEEGNQVQVRQNPIVQFFQNAHSSLLNMLDYITP